MDLIYCKLCCSVQINIVKQVCSVLFRLALYLDWSKIGTLHYVLFSSFEWQDQTIRYRVVLPRFFTFFCRIMKTRAKTLFFRHIKKTTRTCMFRNVHDVNNNWKEGCICETYILHWLTLRLKREIFLLYKTNKVVINSGQLRRHRDKSATK